jgi:hypothetical protein
VKAKKLEERSRRNTHRKNIEKRKLGIVKNR